MKAKILFIIGTIIISIFTSNTYGQATAGQTSPDNAVMSNVSEGLGMAKEVLENRVQSKVLLDIDNKSAELISDGIEAIDETKQAIAFIQSGDQKSAIEYIGRALGKLETIKLRNPKMTMVPVHRVVRTDDLDADLGAIKVIKDNVSSALEQNKFHIALRELESLISEVRIETTNIPITAYPDVLKQALISIEEKDLDTASKNLSTMLNTLVVTKERIALPCMRAEVMLEEALTIQPGHVDPIANRKLLLNNAKEQIDIAYELGQLDEKSANEIQDQIDSAIKVIGTNDFKEKVKGSISEIIAIKNRYNSEVKINS